MTREKELAFQEHKQVILNSQELEIRQGKHTLHVLGSCVESKTADLTEVESRRWLPEMGKKEGVGECSLLFRWPWVVWGKKP